MGKVREPATREGFTVLEVMLFLSVSGLLLIGVIAGTYAAIANQRYNDSVRSFAEYLRQTYAEVISPQSIGNGDAESLSLGNSNTAAIYGKLLVFGLDESDKDDNKIYSATIIGSPDIPKVSGGFIEELDAVEATLFCGFDDGATKLDTTRTTYTPLWQTKIDGANNQQLVGSLIIARSPTSGTVHTAFAPGEKVDLKVACDPSDTSARQTFADLLNSPSPFTISDDVDFCLKSENSRLTRNIRLAADGRNTSAVITLSMDDEEAKCR